MRLTDYGAGRIKALLAIAFLVVVIFCGIKIIPVYTERYQLADFIDNLAVNATVAYPPATADGVTKQVLDEANSLGLPVDNDNVRVTVGHTVTIKVDYSVPVDLMVYTLNLHFTHSAQNSRL
jgi:hypothetical protein